MTQRYFEIQLDGYSIYAQENEVKKEISRIQKQIEYVRDNPLSLSREWASNQVVESNYLTLLERANDLIKRFEQNIVTITKALENPTYNKVRDSYS